ncbi:interferon-induced 35 kDa protein isoform X1 [Corapipo altera]|uniref:interferon-induced 35 kDa protein isoform X1 n=1 Tax=Corapipo altera TaxID=415028 RepID=UPI000FD6A351|nr:interferon-induced 35 kDa protein isoform X1 [Corapipo altera]
MDSEEDSFVQLHDGTESPEQLCREIEQSKVRPGEGVDRLDPDGPESPEQLRREIEQFKDLYSLLEQDCVKLQTAKEATEQRTQELRKEGNVLHKILEHQMSLNRGEEKAHQMELFAAQEENTRLMKEKQVLKNKLEELKRVPQGDLAMMQSGLPEKKMVFKGLAANKEDMNKLMVTPRIRYPLPGGSALITFEKAEVAQRIIEAKEHMVELSCWEQVEDLDQCRMRVQAAPVEILLPSALEIRLTQNSRSIVVSDLPNGDITVDALLDKLELFFSKKKNGGSEVESREFQEDSCQVVLTFREDGVAELLIERGYIQVPILGEKYKVKISPYITGDITNLQLQPSCCPRTVLLSGIPDVLFDESMRDTLEIHFQKPSLGGGEVDALAYVPAGWTGRAVFVEDTG